jgi:hypothetical protein
VPSVPVKVGRKETQQFSNLKPGEMRPINTTGGAEPGFDITFSVSTDPGELIAETDEHNNSAFIHLRSDPDCQ